MVKCKVLLFILIFTAGLFSLSYSEVALIYGNKHLFSISTPDDWIFDRELANQIGLPHFIFPSSEIDSEEKKIFIYAIGADRPEGSKRTIHDFINYDTNNFLSRIPNLKIEKENITFTNIVKNDFLSGLYYVYRFIFPTGRYECVVYIDAIETVVTIVYSADNLENFDKYYKDFIYVVNSFDFLGRNVKVYYLTN